MAKMVLDNTTIDCLIEEHIKGVQLAGNPYSFEGKTYIAKIINGTEHHMPLDAYSTDIAKAWGLVSSFKLWYAYSKNDPNRQRMEWTFGNDLAKGEIVTFVIIVHDGLERKVYSAEGVTLERAICLAVLRAKGIEVQDDIVDETKGEDEK